MDRRRSSVVISWLSPHFGPYVLIGGTDSCCFGPRELMTQIRHTGWGADTSMGATSVTEHWVALHPVISSRINWLFLIGKRWGGFRLAVAKCTSGCSSAWPLIFTRQMYASIPSTLHACNFLVYLLPLHSILLWTYDHLLMPVIHHADIPLFPTASSIHQYYRNLTYLRTSSLRSVCDRNCVQCCTWRRACFAIPSRILECRVMKNYYRYNYYAGKSYGAIGMKL